MKKRYFLLGFILISLSCSTDSVNNINAVNPNLLQRVDFYPDNPNVRHWLFNAKGLLTEIRDVNDLLMESFSYDGNGNMIQNIMYTNGVANSTLNIGYDSTNFMTHINGMALNYDPVEHKFFSVDGFNSHQTFIDTNFLLKESHSLYDDSIDQYHNDNYCNHDANGNMTGYSSSATFGGGPNCGYTHDVTINPLRNAILSIARAKSIYDPDFLAKGLTSVNNLASLHYSSKDPETSKYRYDFNSENLPIQQYCDNYYSGVYEFTTVSVKYYYQGDVLP